MTRPRTRSPRNSRRSFDICALALECVRARVSKARSAKRWPRRSSRSVDEGEHPAEADGAARGPGCVPDCAVIDGEEPELGPSDEVFERNVAHLAPAVVGIVAVVAHH